MHRLRIWNDPRIHCRPQVCYVARNLSSTELRNYSHETDSTLQNQTDKSGRINATLESEKFDKKFEESSQFRIPILKHWFTFGSATACITVVQHEDTVSRLEC